MTNGNLKTYPFNWSGIEEFNYQRDDDGIPLVNMGKVYGLQYNPITISQYGLFCLQNYSLSGEQKDRQRAFSCSHWLIDNFKKWHGKIGAWLYKYDLNFYGPKAPWISGMAQAQGISLLLRVHQLQPDHRIPEITHRAFQAFQFPVKEGGVVERFPDNTPIFEEFTTTPPSKVLNGHIFALLGIYDYAVFWGETQAQNIFETATRGLINNLHLYDTGYWNLYDLHPTRRLASPMYMLVHTRLLRILASLTGSSEFNFFAEKWLSYRRNFLCRGKWLVRKTYEKLRLRF